MSITFDSHWKSMERWVGLKSLERWVGLKSLERWVGLRNCAYYLAAWWSMVKMPCDLKLEKLCILSNSLMKYGKNAMWSKTRETVHII